MDPGNALAIIIHAHLCIPICLNSDSFGSSDGDRGFIFGSIFLFIIIVFVNVGVGLGDLLDAFSFFVNRAGDNIGPGAGGVGLALTHHVPELTVGAGDFPGILGKGGSRR